jgi:Pathogenicity locus
MAQVADDRRMSLTDFQRIPGIGKSLAQDLWDLGYRSVDELNGEDPEAMYQAHCDQRGMKVDRCVLYAFRGAVYYASNNVHDLELLKWWNWKD